MKRKYNILIFNGGRGATSIINSLLKKKNINLYSIVNAYDDGKSTGNLRDIFNILGPSDIRKIQTLFIPKNKNYFEIKKLFELRLSGISKQLFFKNIFNFTNGKVIHLFGIKINNTKIRKYLIKNLNFFIKFVFNNKKNYDKLIVKDLSLINCIYACSILLNDNKVSKSINEFNTIFALRESAFCISDNIRHLCAIERPNKLYENESSIVEKRSNSNIENIFLLKNKIIKQKFSNLDYESKNLRLKNLNNPPQVNRVLFKIIKNADFIIYAPGTQHSSLYPTYMHLNIENLIKKNKKAKKIFITNIGADYETPNYDTYDYLCGAYKYLSKSKLNFKFEDFFDYILINKPNKILYKTHVSHNPNKFKDLKCKLILKNFETKSMIGKHDGAKVVKFLTSLF